MNGLATLVRRLASGIRHEHEASRHHADSRCPSNINPFSHELWIVSVVSIVVVTGIIMDRK